MELKRLVDNAVRTEQKNQYLGWWGSFGRSPELTGAWEQLTTRAARVFNEWFSFFQEQRTSQDLKAKTESSTDKVTVTYGEEYDSFVSAGTAKVWGEYRMTHNSMNRNERRTIFDEDSTRRFIYYEVPASDEFNSLIGDGSIKYVKQVLIGTIDVVTSSATVGEHTLPAQNLKADSLDIVTSFFTNSIRDDHEDPFEVVRPAVLERANLDYPVFDDMDPFASNVFDDNQLPPPYDYQTPYELFGGIHATLDELEALLAQAKASA